MSKAAQARYREKNRERAKAATRLWRANNKARAKHLSLKWSFGISLEEYNQLLSEQGGVCAICKQPCKTGKNLSVDHDHATGRVRGLLCMRCNLVLGQVKDDGAILNAAADYLQRN